MGEERKDKTCYNTDTSKTDIDPGCKGWDTDLEVRQRWDWGRRNLEGLEPLAGSKALAWACTQDTSGKEGVGFDELPVLDSEESALARVAASVGEPLMEQMAYLVAEAVLADRGCFLMIKFGIQKLPVANRKNYDITWRSIGMVRRQAGCGCCGCACRCR